MLLNKPKGIQSKLIKFMLFPFCAILVVVFCINYYQIKTNLMEDNRKLQKQTEQNIISHVVLTDRSYKIAEKLLTPFAEAALRDISISYIINKNSPEKIDLESIKKKYGNKADVYIINESGVIEYTTFEKVKYLDFKKIAPTFYEHLNKIREGERFVSDRLAIDVKTSFVRFWAFMPSSDHKYIFEIGVIPEEVKSILTGINISELKDKLKKSNPSVTQIRFFTSIGYNIDEADSVPNPEVLKLLDTLKDKGELTVLNKNMEKRYLYINLKEKNSLAPTDPSYIIEITYNNHDLNIKMNKIIGMNLILGLFFMLICYFTAYLISKRVSHPIKILNDSVMKFSNKDFSVRIMIDPKENDEIGKLSVAFNEMAETIEKYNMELNTNNIILETKVKERTLELTKNNEILNDVSKRLSDMNATKDKFFSIIAHDLRGPIGVIGAALDDVVNNMHEYSHEELKEMLNETLKSIRNVHNLLQNLLEWARIQKGTIKYRPENIKLYCIFEDCLYVLKMSAEVKHIQIDNNENRNTEVYCDRHMIFSVILNILSNAIKFTPKSGRISIYYYSNEKEVIVCIEDNGQGISEDSLQKLFSISDTLSTVGTDGERGTGLGLILTKEFVEKNNGKLWVESYVGKGSKFYFSLPISFSEL